MSRYNVNVKRIIETVWIVWDYNEHDGYPTLVDLFLTANLARSYIEGVAKDDKDYADCLETENRRIVTEVER